MPKDASNPAELQNLRLSGTRAKDGDKVHATFTRVFDNEAAELEKDLYDILGLVFCQWVSRSIGRSISLLPSVFL